jgi:GR25 family glycosyltransferase involved in LPS biosynthesis
MDPFEYFDEIRCVNLDADTERWRLMQARFTNLRLGDRARRFAAVATPANRRIGQALSHRRVVEEAAERGRRSVLIIEDDVRFFDETIAILSPAVPELSGLDWTTCHLGGCRWDSALQTAPDCRY